MRSVPPDLLIAFQRTDDACTQVLYILKHSTYSPSLTSSTSWPELTSILTDYSSLLSLIYTHATTLSLAMKPPPTYAGATRPLSDLTSDVTKLTSCVHFLSSYYGATLHKEATWRAQEIIESIRSLIHTFIPRTTDNNETTNPPNSLQSAMPVNIPGIESPTAAAPKGNGDDKSYLIRTGAVHSAVEHAKKTLSKSNAQAVLKVWNTHTDALQDALEECEDLANDPSPEDEDDLDDLDDFDDGWGEITGTTKSNRKRTPEEREQASKARTLLKLTLSLHKRLAKHTLPFIRSPPSSAQYIHTLDTFLAHSSALTASIDDLISSLHPPQQLFENDHPPTSQRAQELSTVITALKSHTLLWTNPKPPMKDDTDVTQQLGELKLSDLTSTNLNSRPQTNGTSSNYIPPAENQDMEEVNQAQLQKDTKNVQWLNLCFSQIDKAIQALEYPITPPPHSNPANSSLRSFLFQM